MVDMVGRLDFGNEWKLVEKEDSIEFEHRPSGHTQNITKDGGIKGVADTTLSSSSQIHSKFGNFSTGETVLITRPETPYLTDQWLDIDTDGVTVLCESQYAENGEPVIKVMDGAEVGGVRVGWNSQADNVTIRGFGFDGNYQNQDQSVEYLHGIVVDKATNFEIDNFHCQYTSPHHVHMQGGSGVSVLDAAQDGKITNGTAEGIGDRFVQCAGDNVQISNIRNWNGYDRTVAGGATDSRDDTLYTGDNLQINNIFARNTEDGSTVGLGSSNHVTIDNVMTINTVRGASLKIMGGTNVEASNVVGYNLGSSGTGGVMEINDLNSTPDTITVDGIFGHNPNGGNAIAVDAGNNIKVKNATIRNSGFNSVVNNVAGTEFYNLDLEIDDNGAALRLNEKATVRGLTVRDGAPQLSIQSAAAGSVIYQADYDPAQTGGGAVSTSVINGVVSESASAEEPQGTYPNGTKVRFTDTGDGSGTGTYLYDGGTYIQLSSNA